MGQKNIRRLISLAIIFISSCENSCLNRQSTNKAHEPAASVNDVIIPKKELDDLHKRALKQFKKNNPSPSSELANSMRAGILRKMIDDEIIKQRLNKEKIIIDRFERVEAFESYKTKMGGKKGYSLLLEQQNLSDEQIKKSVYSDLTRSKLVEKFSAINEPTDEEVENYFITNKHMFSTPELINVRHILLKLAEKDSTEKEDLIIKKAHAIIKEFDDGATFIDLVAKYSEGPSAKQGGSLGYFPKGRMVKEFDDLAFLAPLKKAVGPVKTQFGYHIIYVEDKKPGNTPPLPKIRNHVVEGLKRQKKAQKSEEILASLRKEANIDIFDSSMTTADYMSL